MFNRSISVGSADATAQARAWRVMTSKRRSRSAARHHLRVEEAGDVAVRVEDDGAGDDGTGQAAAPDLVAAGDRMEPPAAQGVLDGPASLEP